MGALLSRNDPLAVGRAGGAARGRVGVSSFVYFLLYLSLVTGELRIAPWSSRGLCASCWSPRPFFCLRLDESDSSLLICCWLLTPLQSCGCVVVVFPSSVTKGESAGLSAKASELAKHAMKGKLKSPFFMFLFLFLFSSNLTSVDGRRSRNLRQSGESLFPSFVALFWQMHLQNSIHRVHCGLFGMDVFRQEMNSY